MLNRIKRAYNAFKGTDLLIVERSEMTEEQARNVAKMTGKTVILANDVDKYKFEGDVEVGDGKAVFLSDMTEDEYQEYVRNEENGWKKLKEKIGL